MHRRIVPYYGVQEARFSASLAPAPDSLEPSVCGPRSGTGHAQDERYAARTWAIRCSRLNFPAGRNPVRFTGSQSEHAAITTPFLAMRSAIAIRCAFGSRDDVAMALSSHRREDRAAGSPISQWLWGRGKPSIPFIYIGTKQLIIYLIDCCLLVWVTED